MPSSICDAQEQTRTFKRKNMYGDILLSTTLGPKEARITRPTSVEELTSVPHHNVKPSFHTIYAAQAYQHRPISGCPSDGDESSDEDAKPVLHLLG